MTAAVITVGCRLNQAESDCLRARLQQQGVKLVTNPREADAVYVNTCTVTGNADRNSLALIRRLSRLQPKPRIVVLGCYAERVGAQLTSIPGVDEVWNNQRKQKEIAGVVPMALRSRALLKVQDGCDNGCSYCVVAQVRGKPVSLPAAMVREQFLELLKQGFQEVVLTGLNLGKYQSEGYKLAGLLAMLLKIPGRFRIRLASVEPDCFDEEFLEVIQDSRVCAHFHIPLQSGDDRILAAMGRRYTGAYYRQVIERLEAVKPGANIGADVIVGFPGEDEASFVRTEDFLRTVPVKYLHVFPYALRPGTRAAIWGDVVDRSIKQERVQRLRDFSEKNRMVYYRQFDETVREAVLEPGGKALTDNYMRVAIVPTGKNYRCGQLAQIKLRVEADGRLISGQLLDTAEKEAQ
ncbi:radical SAM protein [candidate division WOR-3 bacterium]|nr:radical SAM protein [candidate division WOR-3 bacterium]